MVLGYGVEYLCIYVFMLMLFVTNNYFAIDRYLFYG